MASSILSRTVKAETVSCPEQERLSICLIGGIYGKDEAYRAKVKMAPETLLENGLKAQGHHVIVLGHRHPIDFEGLDIVHVHHLGYGAIRAAASNNDAPFIYTSHDPLAMSGLLGRSRRIASEFVMSRADAVVALSPAEKKFQDATYPLAGAVHTVIPNGISTENYHYSRHNFAAKGQPWKLLFVGQLIEVKGVDRLLHALALLPQNVHLQLAFHTDTLRVHLEDLARELGLQTRVTFLGSVSPVELKTLYQQSDIFVLPSLGEALPSVVTEAMLCGTPIVATDVGGVRDQLGPFGVLVPAGKIQELARAIGQALDHYDVFTESGKPMSEYAERRFSIPAMVESHLELYRSLLHRKGARRRNRFSRQPMNIVAGLAVRLRCKI